MAGMGQTAQSHAAVRMRCARMAGVGVGAGGRAVAGPVTSHISAGLLSGLPCPEVLVTVERT